MALIRRTGQGGLTPRIFFGAGGLGPRAVYALRMYLYLLWTLLCAVNKLLLHLPNRFVAAAPIYIFRYFTYCSSSGMPVAPPRYQSGCCGRLVENQSRGEGMYRSSLSFLFFLALFFSLPMTNGCTENRLLPAQYRRRQPTASRPLPLSRAPAIKILFLAPHMYTLPPLTLPSSL